MSVDIPVKAFAIAADIAARRMGETVADLFGEAPSRARYVAIAALIQVYPSAAQVEIARCFGWSRDGHSFDAALSGSRASAWWRKSDAGAVAKQLRTALGHLDAESLLNGAEPIQNLAEDGEDRPIKPVEQRDDPPREPVARLYQPRKWRVARIAGAPRPVNPTAALMGDPPAGRREFLAGLASAGRGKENAERAR